MTGRRRTAGLRREEVAQIAGVGLTWYTWFEQGRDIQVSASFLLNVAKALKLDDAECAHLFLLAHRRPPPPEAKPWPFVDPLVQRLLDDLVVRPAYVLNVGWDVVAWNAAADRLFDFARFDRGERNFLRIVLTDPTLRSRLPAWRSDAERLVAQFRCDLTGVPGDPAILSLIEDLKLLSPDARAWFQQRDMAHYARGVSIICNSNGEPAAFDHQVLIVDEHRHLRMIVCFER